MTHDEQAIMSIFRQYDIGPRQMLFINNVGTVARLDVRGFQSAMQKLIDRGFVVKDRPKHAYCLTHDGYRASLAGQCAAAR